MEAEAPLHLFCDCSCEIGGGEGEGTMGLRYDVAVTRACVAYTTKFAFKNTITMVVRVSISDV